MPIPHLTPFGKLEYASGTALAASVPTMAALTALAYGDPARAHGNEVTVDADGSKWTYNSASTLTSDGVLVQSADDVATYATGRWIRSVGPVELRLPIAYTTADNAVLLTVPTGYALKLESMHWRVTTGFTGGTASAIGISSSVDTTQGDLLGGATGDVTATLGTAGRKAGTIGAKMDSDSELHAQLLAAGATIVFDRITSAYTAGAGFAVVIGEFLVA